MPAITNASFFAKNSLSGAFSFLLPAVEADEVLARVRRQIGEIVDGFAEHAGGGFAERCGFHLAVRLQILDERHEIAVARDDDDRVELGREADSVDRKADVPIPFLCAAEEHLEVFDLGLDAELVQRFEEAFLFAAFGGDDVGDRADKLALPDQVFDDIAEVHAALVEILRTVVEVLRIDEYADALFFVFDDSHIKRFPSF